MLLRSQSVKRDQDRVTGRNQANRYFNAISAHWSENNIKCRSGTNIGGISGLTGGNQTIAPGSCACSYSTPDGTTINSIDSSGTCSLTIPAKPLD